MEVKSVAADAVKTRPQADSTRRNWKAVIDQIKACPAGQAVSINLGSVSDKALKQARWNLQSACKNAVEDGKLAGVPDIQFGEEPGSIVVIPFRAPATETASDSGKGRSK